MTADAGSGIGRSTSPAAFMRWKLAASLLGLAVAAPAPAAAVERLRPSLDGLISVHAKVVPIYREYDGFFEGPVWITYRGGFLVFSDIPGNRLLAVSAAGRVSTFLADVITADRKPLHDTLYTNRDLVGPNGAVLQNPGSLVLAVFGGDRLDVIDLSSGGHAPLIAGDRETKFSRPNDLALSHSGDLYFSAEEGLFRVHGGAVSLFRAMKANGLAFSPDGRFLYASDGPSTILRIAVNPDGSAGTARIFLETHGDPAKDEFLDGMKVDTDGNVWAAAPGGIWIMDPAGQVLGKILAPTVEMPTGAHHRFTNLAFGGRHGSILYLTAPGGVYRVDLVRKAAGVNGGKAGHAR